MIYRGPLTYLNLCRRGDASVVDHGDAGIVQTPGKQSRHQVRCFGDWFLNYQVEVAEVHHLKVVCTLVS